MSELERFFPAGLALGRAFCNRIKEKEELKQSILRNEPTVVISPRRYGKTSLITQVVEENKLAYCSIDLLPATNEQYIKNVILDGVGQLLPHILPKQKVMMEKLLSFFEKLNPKITLALGKIGFSVELTTPQAPDKGIAEALMALDKVAQEVKKRVVILMDEFQQISSISNNHVIEASIRHAVERSKNVSYVFSGSDRHTLEGMFNDKARPLYHLCKLIRIERIHKDSFVPFIQNAAKERWNKLLEEETLNMILELTQCHTYYVNYLCRQLWSCEKIPNMQNVYDAWNAYVSNQLAWITDDVGALSANQRIILSMLVSEPTKEIFGHYFSEKIGLPIASIRRAIETLQKNNMIYKDEAGVFHVLDPAIATYLLGIKSLFEHR